MADSGGSPKLKTKDTMKFSPKDRVEHSVFGTGTIADISTQRITIDFDETGTRTFITSMVKLAPSDTPAPATRRRKKKTTAKK